MTVPIVGLNQMTCDVDRDDIVKMSSPNETIISGASSTVRVKLSFNKSDVNAARVALKVAVANVF